MLSRARRLDPGQFAVAVQTRLSRSHEVDDTLPDAAPNCPSRSQYLIRAGRALIAACVQYARIWHAGPTPNRWHGPQNKRRGSTYRGQGGRETKSHPDHSDGQLRRLATTEFHELKNARADWVSKDQLPRVCEYPKFRRNRYSAA